MHGTAVDPTTGLPRLGASGTSLSSALALAYSTQRRVALLHIDVDNFTAINTDMGGVVGDHVLHAVARRLQRAIPKESCWLWRLAGDEFIVAIGYRPGEADGPTLAERLRAAFDTPLSIPPYTVPVTLSIGISIFPDHAASAATLLSRAEEALGIVRSCGTNSVAVYSADYPRPTVDGIGKRGLSALINGDFRMLYRPQVSGRDGTVVAMSAQVRWPTQRGELELSQFITPLHRAGLAPRLGLWMLDTAMAQLAKWRAEGLDYLTVSVRLLGSLLTQQDCAAKVADMLHRHRVPAEALDFEISESVLTQDSSRAHESLEDLRRMGATLTVHDFGLGGLSFPALAQLSVDRLKIDRSFMRDITCDPRRAAIVRGIVAMGHQLGLRIIASGVQSEVEHSFLLRNNCDFFEGPLFSPERPVEEVGSMIRRRFLTAQAGKDDCQRTLLLLDDEENVLRSLTRLFRRDGYKVLTASSPSEAFDLLASHNAQVIVSDQRMPIMSGTEFLSRVRDMYPDTVRMVLSGYTDLATITDAINRGAIYRFLTKPWKDEDLRQHILEAFRWHERSKKAIVS